MFPPPLYINHFAIPCFQLYTHSFWDMHSFISFLQFLIILCSGACSSFHKATLLQWRKLYWSHYSNILQNLYIPPSPSPLVLSLSPSLLYFPPPWLPLLPPSSFFDFEEVSFTAPDVCVQILGTEYAKVLLNETHAIVHSYNSSDCTSPFTTIEAIPLHECTQDPSSAQFVFLSISPDSHAYFPITTTVVKVYTGTCAERGEEVETDFYIPTCATYASGIF